MNRNLRIGILIAVIGVAVLAVGMFIFIRMVSSLVFTPPEIPEAQPTAAVMQVVVTTHDVKMGDLLLAQDVTVINVPIELVPRNAMTELEAVIDRIAKYPMASGEMVLNHHLADPTNINHDIAFVLQDDAVLMAFPAGDLMSSLGVIQRGDIIDIFASITQQAPVEEIGTGDGTTTVALSPEGEPLYESRLFTFDAFQRVGVTAMVVDIINQEPAQNTNPLAGEPTPAPTPIPKASDINVQAYLLALNPQDALLLKHLVDTGAIFDLVLRSPLSTQYYELEPIISEFLIDKYQLNIKQ